MNELQAILIFVALLLAVAVFFFARRSTEIAKELQAVRSVAESRQHDNEQLQKKLDHRATDLEEVRRQLQDVRNKLERAKKER
ncbi:MAG: hypothetical protein HC923_03200, partial [Myxococcales bacterium]|nr:hypothetical protein [Myxococcales bacterium]